MDHDEDMDPEAEAKTPIVRGCPVIIEDLVFHLGDDYAHVTLLDRWVDGWRSMALVRIEEGEVALDLQVAVQEGGRPMLSDPAFPREGVERLIREGLLMPRYAAAFDPPPSQAWHVDLGMAACDLLDMFRGQISGAIQHGPDAW